MNQKAKNVWDEDMKVKKLAKQIVKDSNKLVDDIAYGELKDIDESGCVAKGQVRNIEEQLELNKMAKAMRRKADRRAEPRQERDKNKYILQDVRKLDCHQRKPLEDEIFGHAVFTKTPLTSYGATF